MATETATASTETPSRSRTIARQLNGTSFLTLEHIGYFVLVALLPTVLGMGILAALDLWSNGGNASIMPMTYTTLPILSAGGTTMAIEAVAALIVLAAMLYVLRRRVAAEYDKRPGYRNRLAYKLPVYTALGLLVAATASSLISMVAVFLNSLTQIGVNGADIGRLYMNEFVPALLMFALYGLSGWYVACLAKGKDSSKLFVGLVELLAVVVCIALFVTTLSINHQGRSTPPNPGGPIQPQPYPYPGINDNYLNY